MVGKPKTSELHPGPGFRIRDEVERPDPELVAGFGAFETPAISDLMNRLYTMDPDIRPMTNPDLTDPRTGMHGPVSIRATT